MSKKVAKVSKSKPVKGKDLGVSAFRGKNKVKPKVVKPSLPNEAMIKKLVAERKAAAEKAIRQAFDVLGFADCMKELADCFSDNLDVEIADSFEALRVDLHDELIAELQ